MFETTTIPSDLMIDVVTKLFIKFKDRYQNAMTTKDGNAWGLNKVLEWADYFTSKNATLDELRTAYTLCKDRFVTFPPNEVEFLNLVRQSQYPDVFSALRVASECVANSRYETVKADAWQHVAIYETAHRLGFGEFNFPQSVLEPKFKAVYQQVCDELQAGKEMSIPIVPLIEIKHTPNKEHGAKVLAKLKGKLGATNGK